MKVQLIGGLQDLPYESFSDLIPRLAELNIEIVLKPVSVDVDFASDLFHFLICSIKAAHSQAVKMISPQLPVLVYSPNIKPDDTKDPVRVVFRTNEELFLILRGMGLQKNAFENLSHHRLLAEIVENSPDIVSYSDNQFKIKYMNRTGLERFGYSSVQQIEGLSAFSVGSDNPDDPETTLLLQYLHKNGIWRGEKELTGPGSTRIPAELIIQFHRNRAGDDFYSLIARDITQQKSREKRIIELQKLYETLAEASQEMIMVVSDQGELLYLNQASRNIFKPDMDELFATNILEASAHYTPAVYQSIRRVFHDHKTDYIEDVFRYQEENHWLGTWLVPIPDQDSEIHSILLVSRDISREKESEISLINSLDKEREFNELQSRFVSMISHEFKTPLSTILSSIELLKNYHDQLAPGKRELHANRIQDAVRVMNDLLEDILLIGKIKEQGARMNPEWIDPVKFCSELMENTLWNDQFGHPIKLTVSGECIFARVDPNILRHILDNVLNNAIKYSESGSKIFFNLNCGPDTLKFEILDNGMGISPETMEHIYEPFFRGKDLTGMSGTGLGLTIVQKAVDILQGTIEIHSDVGQGTRVFIAIPVETGTDPHD